MRSGNELSGTEKKAEKKKLSPCMGIDPGPSDRESNRLPTTPHRQVVNMGVWSESIHIADKEERSINKQSQSLKIW